MNLKIFNDPKNLTHNEKFLLDKINEFPVKFLDLNIVDFSKEFFTTKSTLSRLVRKLSFNSVLDMKLHCQRELTKNGLYQLENESNTESRISNLKTFNNYGITNTIENLDFPSFKRACKRISTSEKIMIFGIGSSYLACYDLANNLQRFGINAFSKQEIHETLVILPNFTKKDLVIIFSDSQDSKEVTFLLKTCYVMKVKTILITSNEGIKECYTEKILLKNMCEDKCISNRCSKTTQIIITDGILDEIYFANKNIDVAIEKSVDILNRWKKFRL